MTQLLDAIVIAPETTATAAILWLHGLGADGNDFAPVVRQLGLPGRGIRAILPHAPYRPVTINGGSVMRAWYDVVEEDLRRRPDATGIRTSAEQLTGLVQAQRASGIPAERIVLAGFSQGGAIALHAGLRYPERLGGIMGLSTYLPLPESLEQEGAAGNREVPIFLGHGTGDPLIPLLQAEQSAKVLSGLGYRPEIHRYPMAHSVCIDELEDIDRWLWTALP